MIKLTTSTTYEDFKPLTKAFHKDFGTKFSHTIRYYWCRKNRSETEFWRVWLVKKGKETVGVCGLYNLPQLPDAAWLGWFAIVPELRGQKIGESVLIELEKRAKRSGYNRLMSYVHRDGKPLNFYRRNGFEIIDRVKPFAKKNLISMDEFEHPRDIVIHKNLE